MKRTGFQRKTAKPMRRVSTARAKQLREYARKRVIFLGNHPLCQLWLHENGWSKVEIRPGSWTLGYFRRATDFTMVTAYPEALIKLGAPLATEVHHMNKRRGAMLLEEEYWMAVSAEAHKRIEANKAWARAQGFLLNF